MREVALVGFAPGTRDLWKTLPESVEIWTLNWAWKHGIERISRLFELHDPVSLRNYAVLGEETEREHVRWLMETHSFPIYTLHPAEYPMRVAYPLEGIVSTLFGKRPAYLTSSFAYMLAMAIFEGVDRIYVYGFEMSRTSEYMYQKAGAEYLLGLAMGRGVEIVLPEQTNLLVSGLYGMGGQAIGRQSLEHAVMTYREMERKTEHELSAIKGAIKALSQLLRVIDDQN